MPVLRYRIDPFLPLEIAVTAAGARELLVEVRVKTREGTYRDRFGGGGDAVRFVLAPFGGAAEVHLVCTAHGRPGDAVEARAEILQSGRSLGFEDRRARMDAGFARLSWTWTLAAGTSGSDRTLSRGTRSRGSVTGSEDPPPQKGTSFSRSIRSRGPSRELGEPKRGWEAPGEDEALSMPADREPRSSAPDPVAAPSRAHGADADAANAEYRVWYGTNRKPVDPERLARGYSRERDETVHHGTCRVFVPRSHKIGSLGSPWWKRLLTATDDRLKLRGIEPTGAAEHWRSLREAVARLAPGEDHAVVFLHGYNVSFKDAALRAAQIGFDLQVRAMGFFSWPSRGTLKGYAADAATIEASEAAIAGYLQDFARASGAARVHVIAHSMGNRGLLRAVNRIVAGAERAAGVSFGQFILAAADVDVDLFRDLSRAYRHVCQRSTLYVSGRDRAVAASRALHGAPRVGFAPPVTIVPHVDTVSVSNLDLTLLGHGYVAEARDVLHDMYALLVHGAPPERRMGLRPAKNERGEPYWEIGA